MKRKILVSFILLLTIFLSSCKSKDNEKIEISSFDNTKLVLNVYEDSNLRNISNDSSFNLKKDTDKVVFEIKNPQPEKPIGVYINGNLLGSITSFSKRSFDFTYDELRKIATSDKKNELKMIQCHTKQDFNDLLPDNITDTFTTSFSFK